MKRIASFLTAALAAVFLCPQAKADAGFILDDGFLVNASSLTASGVIASQTYAGLVSGGTTYFRTDSDSYLSAETMISSDTFANLTFTDGSASTASLTVNSFVGLSSATASGKFTISSNTALAGQCLSGGGITGSFNVCNPANFAIDLSFSTNTACNIASAINASNVIVSSCNWGGSSGVVFATAPIYGAVWNQFELASSSQSAAGVTVLFSSTVFQAPYSTMTGVGIGFMAGGQDNATITVHGTVLQANRDWYPITSNAATATSIATAITNSSTTTNVKAAAGSQSTTVVFATSTVVGTAGNAFAIFSSSQSVVSVSSPVVTGVTSATGYGTGSTTMFGGTASAYVIGSGTITIANSFASGLPVWVSTSNNVIPAPLVWGTTYYVIGQPFVPSGSFGLATSLANAITGTGAAFTSSTTQTTANTFTLNPSAIAGTPTLQWLVSDDATNWVPYTTSPAGQSIGAYPGFGTYVSTGAVNMFDFGHMDHGFVGLVIVPPTAGALNFKAKIIGKSQ